MGFGEHVPRKVRDGNKAAGLPSEGGHSSQVRRRQAHTRWVGVLAGVVKGPFDLSADSELAAGEGALEPRSRRAGERSLRETEQGCLGS